MTRREFLWSGASVLGAAGAGYGAAVAAGAIKTCSSASRPVDGVTQSLMKIGEHYLRAVATPSERTRLRAHAARRAGDPAHRQLATSGRIVNPSPDTVQADFRSGNVVSCDGWILARSEAEACALLALSLRS